MKVVVSAGKFPKRREGLATVNRTLLRRQATWRRPTSYLITNFIDFRRVA